jgi:5-methylthioadenosine/S-adenosylhomocysteine deaminase
MRDRGITLGIGTDGCLSSDNQNVFEAMRIAARISRVQGSDPRQWLSALEAFEAATKGGARALGMGTSIGQLALGFKADVVFLDLTSINYVPLNEPLLHVVFVETALASIASWSAAGCWSKAVGFWESTW